MADATFNDVLEEQKRTNAILERDAMEEGKPNPKKFLKEEALSILLQRKYAKDTIGMAKKGNEIASSNEKANVKSGKVNTRLFQDQLDEQSFTTAYQVDTTESIAATNESVVELTESTTSGLESVREAIFSLISRNNKADIDNKRDATKIRLQSNLDGRERITELRESLGKIMSPFGKALGKLGGAIGGLAGRAGRGAMNALDFLKNTFGKIIGAGLLVGMLAFFNSQAFKDMVAWFQGPGLEMIANFYDKIFKPAIVEGFAMLKDIFTTIGNYFSKPEFKEAFRLIKEGKIFDALGLGLRTITDDLGKQFGIENLSKKIGTALIEFYNTVADRLNFIISGLNPLPGTNIPKLPMIDLETGEFETAEGAAKRAATERVRKFEEGPFTKKAFDSAKIEASTGRPEKLEKLTELAQRPGTTPKDIVDANRAIDTTRASLEKSIDKRDEINDMLESNLADQVRRRAAGQKNLVRALEGQAKDLRAAQEEAARKTAAATAQFNNATTVRNVDQSTTVAGSNNGSMRPLSEVTDALSKSMAF